MITALGEFRQLEIVSLYVFNDRSDYRTFKSAQDQLNALRRNSNYEHELPDWCHKAVEIAALLHDIGHGPFSHNWENVCGESFDVSCKIDTSRLQLLVLYAICVSLARGERVGVRGSYLLGGEKPGIDIAARRQQWTRRAADQGSDIGQE